MNKKNINPVAYFFICYFFGGLGVHKFIDGKVGIGILYLLTLGCFGIGWLIDIIKSFILIFKSKKGSDTNTNNSNNSQYSNSPIPTQPQVNLYKEVPAPVCEEEKEFGARDLGQLPEKIENCCIAYFYFIPIEEINLAILTQIKNSNEFNLTLDEQGNVLYKGSKLGVIKNDNRVTMYSDWKRKNWPFICELNRAKLKPTEATLRIGFYRDNNKYFDSKYNKITCKLSACSSEEKQMEIDTLEIGSVLDYETEFNDRTGNEDYLVVKSDYIGKLPKKAVKIEEEYGINAITVEAFETDNNGNTVPILNIYY